LLTRPPHTLASPHPPTLTRGANMELFGLLLFGLWILIATVCAVLADGRGHTPDVRSTAPWSAGNLPSEPYASLRM
jgi:hypothetical protein